jgi:glutathione peroxidase
MAETLYEIPVNRIDGAPSALSEYAGKVLLVVNVASACGLTPQYEGLERLYEKYRERGLVVLGFPANDFGAQEPGSNAEIADFCTTKFEVQFPMFEKISVKGEAQHPLYRALVAAQSHATEPAGSDFRKRLMGYGFKQEKVTDVLWNFEKFLVGRDGKVAGRFSPDLAPEDPQLIRAIEAALTEEVVAADQT